MGIDPQTFNPDREVVSLGPIIPSFRMDGIKPLRLKAAQFQKL